jgi:hypothetical protein
MKVTTREEHEVKRDWNCCRCHHPRCSYINTKAYVVDTHVKKDHKEMKKDIKILRWFWGTLHTMMMTNPKISITEALGQESPGSARWNDATNPSNHKRHWDTISAKHMQHTHKKDGRHKQDA